MSEQQRIAAIGLGSLGYGMATSLKRAGMKVVGCDLSFAVLDRFKAEGNLVAASPAEAGEGADLALSVVVDAAQTEAVLFGAGGVAETLPRGGCSSPRRPWTGPWPAAKGELAGGPSR